MIERRQGANAHEFPGADLDDRNAQIVMKMRDYRIRHVLDFQFVLSLGKYPQPPDTIAGRVAEFQQGVAPLLPKSRKFWAMNH
jgi:hypothetical protein